MHPIGAEHHEVDLPLHATTVVMNSQPKRHSGRGCLAIKGSERARQMGIAGPHAWQRSELLRLAGLIRR